MQDAIALIALASMEIVLGIDNLVVIAIVTSRLPPEQQPKARKIGLALALIVRIGLLSILQTLMRLTNPLVRLSDYGLSGTWLTPGIDAITIKDLIMFGGGLFLIWKSVNEIHKKLEQEHEEHGRETTSFANALTTIIMMDVIFSLDSVITAVGMAEKLWVMIVAVIVAIVVMMVFAERVSRFVHNNPTIKMLALSFLILIGVMLVAEGIGTHIAKGYIYFAMSFSLIVEFLNLRVRSADRISAA